MTSEKNNIGASVMLTPIVIDTARNKCANHTTNNPCCIPLHIPFEVPAAVVYNQRDMLGALRHIGLPHTMGQW